MHGHDIIVIGASAGGMEALRVLVGGLPSNLAAAVFIVWHIPAHSVGVLPDVLARSCSLSVGHGLDGEEIEPGHIYVAGPDRHLLLEDGKIRLTRGPKENHFRPAVDPLFRSAAAAYGSRVIGVVLSGALDDGTAGLWAIKDRGGIAIVQDPDEALYSSMPLSAIEHVEINYRKPVAEIGPLLAKLALQPADEEGVSQVSDELNIENRIAMEDSAIELGITSIGTPTLYTCPECHGVLMQLPGMAPLRFRCHTGHAYTAEALIAHATDTLEEDLWGAVRAMDENLFLLRQIAEQLSSNGNSSAAERLLEQAQAIEQQSKVIRQVALQHGIPGQVLDRSEK